MYKIQVYMVLYYYVPFVDFISIFLLCVFLDSNPAFNDATDCATKATYTLEELYNCKKLSTSFPNFYRRK